MIMWGSTRAAIVATSRTIILQLNEQDILTNLEKSTAARREEWRMEKVERDNGGRQKRRVPDSWQRVAEVDDENANRTKKTEPQLCVEKGSCR